MRRKCDNCGKEYEVDLRNFKRGWGRTCSKSCAASMREKFKVGYNPDRVAKNNLKRTSEGYKVRGGVAYDKFDSPIYRVDPYEDDLSLGWE